MSERWRRLAELFAGATAAAVAIVLTQALTPYFLAVAVPMLIVWFTVIHRGRQLRQSRMIRGLCTYCGYDLRATLDRCPECGNPMQYHSESHFFWISFPEGWLGVAALTAVLATVVIWLIVRKRRSIGR